MIKALIFDFDGLILDTESPEYDSWKAIYADYGLDLPMSLWMNAVGAGYQGFDPLKHLIANTDQPLDTEAIRARHRQQDDDAIAKKATYPGVRDYITTAQELGLKLAVASSSSHRWVDGHLQRLGLYSAFDVIVCSDDVAHKKPAPDLFLAALASLGLQPHEAVVLEDSANGIIAARAAGIFVLAVPNEITRHANLSQADHLVPSLAELPLPDLLTLIRTQRQAQAEQS